MTPVGTDQDLDLSGTWRAGVADEELRRTWYSDDFDDTEFVDIDVPGHWRNNDRFVADDEPLLYRRRFSTLTPGADTRAWLLLDGVCTQGDVWLDDAYLGNTEGAWVPHRFEVTDALAARNDHVVGIEVASPPVGDRSSKRGLLGTLQDGPYVSPGWNPGGIWRPVTIHRTGPVAIASHRVLCTAATSTRAIVMITCELDCETACEVKIRTTVAGVDHERRQPLARGSNSVTWTVAVPDPDLWWPGELGGQPLTEVTVDVAAPTEQPDAPTVGDGFIVSDGFSTRCGLRQVALRDWILTVNGERLFVRGVLVGPTAPDLATAPDDVVTAPVHAAEELGCNLIRVHAHLAPDALYDAADRAGMLVWQDLPLYRGQSRSVRRTAVRTAEATVDRLGAHPSVVVWCGHDEPDDATGDGQTVGFGRRLVAHQLPNWNRSVLDRSVKRALGGADPSRPVIGSSGTWPHPPSLAGTDTHLDLGWSGGDVDDLARVARTIPRAVRFVQVTPSPSSTDPPPAHLAVNWPPATVDDLVGDSPVDPEVLQARLPPDAFDSADEWHRATLGYQSLLIRTQVETLRRLKYRPTGGFVIAHLADLRPVLSPALIDHTGARKPAFDTLRAVCAPMLVTLDPWPGCTHPGDHLELGVHLVNDTRSDLAGARCAVRLSWVGGGERWEFEGDLAADSVGLIGRIALDVPDGIERIDAALHLTGDSVDTGSHYTVPVHVHGQGDGHEHGHEH
jgi:beta-mannosidase